MKILKSVFISSYMMLAVAIAALSTWNLFNGGSALAWTGALLTVAPVLHVLGRLMILRNEARTSAHLPKINALAALGVASAILAGIFGDAGWLPAVVAAAGWIGFLLYAYWYSHLDRTEDTRLEVGKRLPFFTLTNQEVDIVDSEVLSVGPAIILFYRGNWCPVCMAQIKELAERSAEFAALGVRVALISPQPFAHTVALARKHAAATSLEFYTDKGNAAARILGIDDRHGLPLGMQVLGYASETVLPTLIVTDREGRVIWTDETENYRVRPEPDTYLNVMRESNLVPQAA